MNKKTRYHISLIINKHSTYHVFLDAQNEDQAIMQAKEIYKKNFGKYSKGVSKVEIVEGRGYQVNDYKENWEDFLGD